MGLDMYVFITKEAPEKLVDFSEPDDCRKLHYWRKHWHLHEWMKAVYERKGGCNPDFNLNFLVLESGDLDWLEAEIRGRRLGESSGCISIGVMEMETEDDLRFVVKARKAIAEGLTVIYLAWW